MRLSYHIAISVVSVTVFFIVWQVAASRQWVDPLLLPSLTDIGLTTEELLADGYRQVPLWEHVAVSLARALSAFSVAIIIGIPLGLLMGLSEGLAAVLNPFVQFLRPLPQNCPYSAGGRLAGDWRGLEVLSHLYCHFP
ncbi:Taurine transport system permease TauC [Klebsiella michiganensis]|nr:Taurine transport system permease TauC [Klebsiella michiganensis]